MDEVVEQNGSDAVDRILRAIDAKHIPAHLDRELLAAGLMQCLNTYYAAVERNSENFGKATLKAIRAVYWVQARGGEVDR